MVLLYLMFFLGRNHATIHEEGVRVLVLVNVLKLPNCCCFKGYLAKSDCCSSIIIGHPPGNHFSLIATNSKITFFQSVRYNCWCSEHMTSITGMVQYMCFLVPHEACDMISILCFCSSCWIHLNYKHFSYRINKKTNHLAQSHTFCEACWVHFRSLVMVPCGSSFNCWKSPKSRTSAARRSSLGASTWRTGPGDMTVSCRRGPCHQSFGICISFHAWE